MKPGTGKKGKKKTEQGLFCILQKEENLPYTLQQSISSQKQ